MFCFCMLLRPNSMEYSSTELLFYTYRSNKKCLTRDETMRENTWSNNNILVANICKIEFRYHGLMPLTFLVFACYLDLTGFKL